MVITIEILKTPYCPFCPTASEVVKKVAKGFGKKVKVIETDITEGKGREKALFLGVTAVPTILLNNMITFTGVPREEFLKQAIQQKLSEEK